ncbi:unnamed protein product [Closterium sp. NIES-54]
MELTQSKFILKHLQRNFPPLPLPLPSLPSPLPLLLPFPRPSPPLPSPLRTLPPGSPPDDEREIEIGAPTGVSHVTHVTFDRFQGFLGLPDDFHGELPARAPSAR